MAGASSIAAMPSLIKQFATHLTEERGRSPRTVVAYVGILDVFAAFLCEAHGAGGEALLDVVDKGEVSRFLRQASPRGNEPSEAVFNLRLSALRTFFEWLVREEKVSVNPALRLDHQKVKKTDPIPLDFDEMLRLVDAAGVSPASQRDRDTAVIQVFVHCSLRVGEVVSLNLSQVDLDRYLLVDVRVKGGKKLSVPMNDIVAEALERYMKVRDGNEGEAALFVSNRGSRLSIRAAQELVKRCARRAKLTTRTTCHILRHSSASELADLGTPVSVIKEHLGHESVLTTQRYIHPKSTATREAVTALGARWRRGARAAAKTARRTSTTKRKGETGNDV
ncbi:MAG: tyrosine-type recombinase/integrase [Thermoanaerobaculia bacterium]|nr:tyrosine-type recombinase/integrase [Thermoanaerobaculia bacterium]